MTPIGTPPNAVAIGFLLREGVEINFLQWMMCAIPFGVILLFINSALLYFIFPSKEKKINYSLTETPKVTSEAIWVILIGILTALLWLTSYWHKIPEALTALLAVGLLTVFGFFSKCPFGPLTLFL